MPLTTVSFLLLFGFGTNCRLLSLTRYVPFHRGLQVSIDGHPDDSDVNLETFVLFLSHTPARFYLSVELGFIVCFLHFMHICHARHYSTLRNVHYVIGKEKEERRRKKALSVLSVIKEVHGMQSGGSQLAVSRDYQPWHLLYHWQGSLRSATRVLTIVVARTWNSLPSEVTSSKWLQSFRQSFLPL